jgi:hypothetical protein
MLRTTGRSLEAGKWAAVVVVALVALVAAVAAVVVVLLLATARARGAPPVGTQKEAFAAGGGAAFLCPGIGDL